MKKLTLKPLLISLAALLLLSIQACQEQEFEPAEPGLLVPPTVDQDPSLPQIHVNGTLLHAEAFGDPSDPMIVVLHGGPGGDYRAMLNCKAFADHGYYVVFYDQRGSGLSQRHSKSTYHLNLMVDDLEAVIQHYRQSAEQKTFLLGLSWGAMLATAYIDRYPGHVSGAVLAEPGGFKWRDAKVYITRTMEGSPLSEDANDTFYFDQILTGKEDEQAILDYKFSLKTIHDYADGNKLGNPGPSPFWRHGAMAHDTLFEIAKEEDFDFTKNLRQFTTPVLFLYSENNKAYGLSHAQQVSSAYPNVLLAEVTGTGHEMIHFGWKNFYPIVLQYLNSNN